MGRRLLLAALLGSALLADAAAAPSLAFWSLVGAVPLAAACGLASFGAVLLLVAAASRGPGVALGEVPRIGQTALVGCLAVLALKLAVFAVARLQLRLGRRPATAAALRS